MSDSPCRDDLERRLQRFYSSSHLEDTSRASALLDDLERCLIQARPQQSEAPHMRAIRPDAHSRADAETLPPPARQSLAPSRPTTMRALPALIAALLLVALSLALFGPLNPRGYLATGNHHATPAPSPALIHGLTARELLPNAGIAAIQMLSAENGWAVGHIYKTNTEIDSLILHYSGGRWQTSPQVFRNVGLNSLSMISPDDGWAAGDTDFPAPLDGVLLHYTRGAWVRVPAPDHLRVIQVQMLSAEEGWAVQVQQDDTHMPDLTFYLAHYSHGVWSRADTGGMTGLIALSMVSPTEGWAAGDRGVIAHYQNGQWTRWRQTAPGDVTMLTMISPNEGWMSGVAPDDGIDGQTAPETRQVFLLHYHGGAWQPVDLSFVPTSSGPGRLWPFIGDISIPSAGSGMAVGGLFGASSLILQYVGGTWTTASFQVDEPLDAISMVSPSEGWAAGSRQDMRNGEAAVLLHYHNGAWSVYTP